MKRSFFRHWSSFCATAALLTAALPSAAQWGGPVPGLPISVVPGLPASAGGTINTAGQYVPPGMNPYAMPQYSPNPGIVMPWIYMQQNAANPSSQGAASFPSPSTPKLNSDGSVTLSASEIPYVLQQMLDDVRIGFPSTFVVEGTKVVRQDVLVAEEIRFLPGAVLVFDNPFNTAIRIIAKRVIVDGGSRPALVTWSRDDANSAVTPPVGKASPGSPGQQEGEAGRKGEPGALGNLGFAGRSAPEMYVAVSDISGGKLLFDLRGQNASTGGLGQAGGDGGAGAPGLQSLSSPFDCRRPGGTGGDGGEGGEGGIGGRGGQGGNGGILVLLSTEASIETALKEVNVQVGEGMGGPGGAGGRQGDGGPGGPGGRAAPPCAAGQAGKSGVRGRPGHQGASGLPGVPGRITRVGLNFDQMHKLGLLP